MFEELWKSKRRLWFSKRIDDLKNGRDHLDGYHPVEPKDRTEVTTEMEANLIGSQVPLKGPMRHDDWTPHRPVIDIDYPAQLVPSRTPGHYHLYLDKEISWAAYKKVLTALAEAGLIQHGYAAASIHSKQSFARVPSMSDRWLELNQADSEETNG